MNIEKYLDRIQYKGQTTPDIALLNDLQLHHLLNVPFENLDIHLGNPIRLDINNIYEKILVKNRGGFCYELNGLFFELLKRLGFNAQRISARVYDSGKGDYGAEFDHMAILVKLNQIEYLADVGFGEFAFKTLRLEINKIQNDQRGDFIIEKYENGYFRISKIDDNKKVPVYIFTNKTRAFEEFRGICEYHQTSPHSHFTQKRMISIPTINGRITISGNNLKITHDNKVIVQQQLDHPSDYAANLLNYFNIKALL